MTLIGHDVELFVNDNNTNTIVPADNFINAVNETTNLQSYFEKNLGHSLELNTDNVMLELNPAPLSEMDFALHTPGQGAVLNNIIKILKKHGFNWSISQFHTRYAEACSEHPSFSEFNCRPSLNVWTGKAIKAKTDTLGLYRVAGGHIHFESNDPEDIKMLDLLLGIPEVIVKNQELTLRKQCGYGEAGNFRMRENPSKASKYILEYRVLSNSWFFNMNTTMLIGKITALCTESDRFRGVVKDIIASREKEIIRCINDLDIMLGYSILSEVQEYLTKSLKIMGGNNKYHLRGENLLTTIFSECYRKHKEGKL